jgi:hypothetical protein
MCIRMDLYSCMALYAFFVYDSVCACAKCACLYVRVQVCRCVCKVYVRVQSVHVFISLCARMCIFIAM